MFVLFVVLPKVFESFVCEISGLGCTNIDGNGKGLGTHSSEVFITGHVTGEQNSVIDPY